MRAGTLLYSVLCPWPQEQYLAHCRSSINMCIDKLIKNDYMIAVCGKEDKDLKREFQPKQKSQDGTMSVWGTDGKEQA